MHHYGVILQKRNPYKHKFHYIPEEGVKRNNTTILRINMAEEGVKGKDMGTAIEVKNFECAVAKTVGSQGRISGFKRYENCKCLVVILEEPKKGGKQG